MSHHDLLHEKDKFQLRGHTLYLSPPSNYVENASDAAAPTASLVLQHVHGYQGNKGRSNLFVLPTNEIIYFVAGVVVIMNPSTGSQRFYLGHDNDLTCLAVHSSKPVIASGQMAGTTTHPHIRVWSYETLETIQIIGIGQIQRNACFVAFSVQHPNQLATIDDGTKKIMTVWDWTNATKIAESHASSHICYGLTFNSINNDIIAIGEKHIEFYKLHEEAGKQIIVKKAGLFHKTAVPKAILSIATIQNALTITADSEGDIIIWSTQYEIIKVYNAVHKSSILSLIVINDNEIVTGSKDGCLKTWKYNYHDPTISLTIDNEINVGEGIRCVTPALSSTTQFIVGTLDSNICSVNLETNNVQHIIDGHDAEVWGLGVDPVNDVFYTVGDDAQLMAWNVTQKKLLWRVKIKDNQASRVVEVHPNLDLIVVGTSKGNIETYTKTGQHLKSVHAVTRGLGVSTAKFSPNGAYLAVGAHDDQIDILDATTLTILHHLRGHTGVIASLNWSDDSTLLRSSSNAYELLHWAAPTFARQGHEAVIHDVHWNTESSTISWATKGVWPHNADGTDINSVDRSHDKTLIATGDDFSLVKLFKYPSHVLHSAFHQYGGHSSHVTSVRFVAGDTHLITTGGLDQAILQWQVQRD